MRKSEVATISNMASLISNREVIAAALSAGAFADVLQEWDLDDLSLLAMELKRGEIISEIVDCSEENLLNAIERLGWGDSLVKELEESQ